MMSIMNPFKLFQYNLFTIISLSAPCPQTQSHPNHAA